MAEEERRRERRRSLLIWSIAAVVLAGLVVAITVPIVQRRQEQATTDEAVQTFSNLSRNHVETAVEHAARNDSALDLLAEELRLAQERLSSITGEFTSDDLLGVIFSRFCIGK